PPLSLEGDAQATRQIIDAQDGPVVLVGHSYGGAVITEAGTHPNVAALVYICAFAPDQGESVGSLIAGFPADGPPPPTCPPNRPRSWPTPRSRGTWPRPPERSPKPPGGPSPAGTWSPRRTG